MQVIAADLKDRAGKPIRSELRATAQANITAFHEQAAKDSTEASHPVCQPAR